MLCNYQVFENESFNNRKDLQLCLQVMISEQLLCLIDLNLIACREKQTQVRNVRKSKANFHFKGTANNKKSCGQKLSAENIMLVWAWLSELCRFEETSRQKWRLTHFLAAPSQHMVGAFFRWILNLNDIKIPSKKQCHIIFVRNPLCSLHLHNK